MSIASVLARGRSAAMQLMTDTITITRGGTATYNPDTMSYDVVGGLTLYSGQADVKPLDVQNREVQAGEREVALRSYDVRLPFGTMPDNDAPDFTSGDLLTVDTSADPGLAGRALTVMGVGRGGRRTARHLDAEDRSGA
jgi:hypothetical protein